MDAYGKEVQCEGSESKDSDGLKHFKRHGFDGTKACLEFTDTEIRKTTTYTPIYWIWLNVDKEDPRGPQHKNSFLRPFTTNWEYCVNRNLKNLTEFSDHLERVSKLEDGELNEDAAPKERLVKSCKRKKGQHAKSSTQSSRQDSGATSSQPSVPDVQQRDDSNIAPKIAKQTVTQAAISDADESAILDLLVYIRLTLCSLVVL